MKKKTQTHEKSEKKWKKCDKLVKESHKKWQTSQKKSNKLV